MNNPLRRRIIAGRTCRDVVSLALVLSVLLAFNTAAAFWTGRQWERNTATELPAPLLLATPAAAAGIRPPETHFAAYVPPLKSRLTFLHDGRARIVLEAEREDAHKLRLLSERTGQRLQVTIR